MSIDHCPVTGADATDPVFRLSGVPVLCNRLWPDAGGARAAPSGDLDLVFSPASGLVWNRSFDPARMAYAPGYENPLHHSPRFRSFAKELAHGLVKRHHLAGRDIVEIGCGDGHMLDLMVQSGVRSATGFDPSMADVETPFTAREGVRILPEYFCPGQLDRDFDAILCRHVLEHLEAPRAFLGELRRVMDERDAILYIEVPNAGWMLETVSLWDVIYEHVTYWTEAAMETVLRQGGFEPLSIRSGYGGQFLMAEARPATPDPGWRPADTGRLVAATRGFAAAAEAMLNDWNRQLLRLRGQAVLWGAGSKGVSFVNALAPDAREKLAALVDLNPRKHGKFAPGAALPVVDPGQLHSLDPELVLVANPLYTDEIAAAVKAMGLHPEFRIIAN